ncbi:helix-turn-helix domain-containing protein, partial [Streptomyces sp. NPDC057748]|uniref:helix-turn-helix domain-containing protein n=1 Tax=Streptomyces sp. NPDC057748 TaxID=3346239 RepID=UPI00368647D7
MSEPRSAPTVGQVVLGKRLQDLRERVGLSRDQAAKVLRVAPATIRRMETAEVALKIPYVQMLLKAYGVSDDEADAFVELAEEANKPGWWQRFHDVLPDWFSMYVSLEGAASLLRMYEPHFVPGLLQTEDYARSVMRTGAVGQTRPEDIERHVALRMERQSLLTRPDAPRLWVVMDETVLRRPVGSVDAMREQIDRLLEATEMPHVTLQIAEFSTGHPPGTYGPFVLFRFGVPELPDMVYSEYLTGAVYF